MDRILGSVSGEIRPFFSYPISGRIPDIRFPNIRSDIRKTGYNKTFLLLFEDLRCFNYLSNYVDVWNIWYPAPTGYPAGNPIFKMAGYPAKLPSGPSLDKTSKLINFLSSTGCQLLNRVWLCGLRHSKDERVQESKKSGCTEIIFLIIWTKINLFISMILFEFAYVIYVLKCL